MNMKVAMAGERLTIDPKNGIHRIGPVLYTSLPSDTATARQRLASILWNHLVALGCSRWESCQASSRADVPIKVVHGLLGRPLLLLGGERGPAISFSEGGGKLWAALSSDDSEIGIDVAGSEDFQGKYPFLRVFHPQELEHAVSLADEDLAKASALLWSIKEAVVKALGCAFHLVDPLQITVQPAVAGAAGGDGGQIFPVGLSGKARERFPLADGRSLWVRSLPQCRLWLSIAHLQRRPPDHD